MINPFINYMKKLMILFLLLIAGCQDEAPIKKDDYLTSLMNSQQYEKLISIVEKRNLTTDNIMLLIEAHAGAANINTESTLALVKKLDSFEYKDILSTIKEIDTQTNKMSDAEYKHMMQSLNYYYKLEKSIRNNNKDLNFKFVVIYLHKLVRDIHEYNNVKQKVLDPNRTVKQNISEMYSAVLAVSEDIFKIKVLGDYSYKKISSLSTKLEFGLNKVMKSYNMVLSYPHNTETFIEFFGKTLEMNEQFAIIIAAYTSYKNEDISYGSFIQMVLKNQDKLNDQSKAILAVISVETRDQVLAFIDKGENPENKILTDFRNGIKKEADTFLNYETGELIKLWKDNEKNINSASDQL